MKDQADSFVKELPVGISDFVRIKKKNLYYVDKTPFIRDVFKDASQVLLITRPRRFGKTLAMNTFFHFLRINPENASDTSYQDELFSHTKIYEDKTFCDEYMGRYPVIFLSFKKVDGTSFQEACGMLASVLSEAARQHQYLLNSPKLANPEKEMLSILFNQNELALPQYRSNLCDALELLSKMLCAHYGREVIVLIDEYDVPLANAYTEGYYKEMVKLIRSVLSSVLKDNAAVEKGVLTGCLRVAKESIFTGLNNLMVDTVTSNYGFSEGIGFTPQEVREMLAYYGLSGQEKAVKDWYDGYRVAGRELYCPWDVINYCNIAKRALKAGQEISEPVSFWTSTSGNAVIHQFMSYLDEADAEKMQTLLDGGEAEFVLNEQLNYDEIGEKHRSNDFWTLLLFTGYLTSVQKPGKPEQGVCTVRIPNKEIRAAFEAYIADYYQSDAAVAASSNEIVDAFLAGNVSQASALLSQRLRKFVSIRDMATKSPPENFYHGFLNGVFSATTRKLFTYMSNNVAGDGYADILFSAEENVLGVAIELKASKDEKDMPALSGKALSQIADKKYIEAFGQGITKVYCYGIAFFRKTCFIQCEIKEL